MHGQPKSTVLPERQIEVGPVKDLEACLHRIGAQHFPKNEVWYAVHPQTDGAVRLEVTANGARRQQFMTKFMVRDAVKEGIRLQEHAVLFPDRACFEHWVRRLANEPQRSHD